MTPTLGPGTGHDTRFEGLGRAAAITQSASAAAPAPHPRSDPPHRGPRATPTHPMPPPTANRGRDQRTGRATPLRSGQRTTLRSHSRGAHPRAANARYGAPHRPRPHAIRAPSNSRTKPQLPNHGQPPPRSGAHDRGLDGPTGGRAARGPFTSAASDSHPAEVRRMETPPAAPPHATNRPAITLWHEASSGPRTLRRSCAARSRNATARGHPRSNTHGKGGRGLRVRARPHATEVAFAPPPPTVGRRAPSSRRTASRLPLLRTGQPATARIGGRRWSPG